MSNYFIDLWWWFIFLITLMAFFTSEFECKLDTKGRLVLPAKIKSNLPEVSTSELVLRKGFESNLILYPMLEYKKIHQKIVIQMIIYMTFYLFVKKITLKLKRMI